MTPLLALLRRRIAIEGPMSLARYMAEALGHPLHGYYMTRDPLGRSGDFTTAPEISQMFGELLGLWCADAWLRLGRPDPVLLVELGPGRGTLIQDAWRATSKVPGFHDAARLHLLETSPTLRQCQNEALAAVEPMWIERLADLPEGPVLAVANEFFDALPIRQFQQTENGWRERLIDWNETKQSLVFGLATGLDPASSMIPPEVANAPVGAVAEICPLGLSIAAELGARIAQFGGAAVIVDYGPSRSTPGNSFQAVKDHAFADPLAEPGNADLTAHVDFPMLAQAASEAGAITAGPVEQGAFLTALGINQRAENLKRHASRSQAASIDAALHRLTGGGKDAMGQLFKVLTLVSPTSAPGISKP